MSSNWSFYLHRWLGLIVGILLCIAGITGSILVFQNEMYHWWLIQRFGSIIPTETKADISAIVARLQATYANQNLKLQALDSFGQQDNEPYLVWFVDATNHYLAVVVNPYTGQIMGDYEYEKMWHGIILGLHESLLAGDTGLHIMGIVALLTVILSITGIVLWSGWRKLANQKPLPLVDFAQDTSRHGNTRIYLDRFSGKILRLDDGMKPSRAEAILDQFTSVQFGTFAGIYSRIFYVFVGLLPTILFITGLVMYRYRRHEKATTQITIKLIER